MPRTLTPAAAQAILARETAEVFLCCLSITAGETFRLVNNTEPVVRTEGTYRPYPFDAIPPEDTDTASPTLALRIDNIDRQVTQLIREFDGVPTCEIRWVLASSPNDTQYGPFAFSVLGAEYDALVIGLSLGFEEDFLNQAVPAQTYSPTSSPGIFV